MVRFSRSATLAVALGVILPLAPIVGCGGGGQAAPTSGQQPEGSEESVSVLNSTPEISGAIKAEDPEEVVATVNGSPITAGDVTELAQVNKIRMRAQGMTLPEGMDQQLMIAALSLLIDGELMVQQARAEGIEVPAEEIEAEMQAARAQFPSEEAYREHLADTGLDDDMVREEAERRVLMRAYQAKVVKGQRVDEAMARRIYEENPKQFTEGEQIRASQILVRSNRDDPEAKRDEAKKRIEEVHAKLLDGADFATVAKEYSQAGNAAKGGDLGYFPKGVMVPMLEEVALRTPVGEVSPVFETIYGFNILKVTDRTEPDLKPFAEVKPWIMVELAKMLENQALEQKLAELRSSAQIEILDDSLIEEEPTEAAQTEATEKAASVTQ